jgi:desulfoferrodoxin (superoxide reductase-like protein)
VPASSHPFSEGDRVVAEHVTIYGPHHTPTIRTGTVAQVSETQPHITWVDWDLGPRFQMVGTSHLRPETEADHARD